METPVYLFTGFLEAGKTKFVQETLSDPNFFKPEDVTLVLQFEEGEEELDPSLFASDKVFIETQIKTQPRQACRASEKALGKPRHNRIQRYVAAAGAFRRSPRRLAHLSGDHVCRRADN